METQLGQKTCSSCKAMKPLTEFYAYRRSKDGKRPSCIPCYNDKGRKYHARHGREVTCLSCGVTFRRVQADKFKGRCRACCQQRQIEGAATKRSKVFEAIRIRNWKNNAVQRGIAWSLRNEDLDAKWHSQQGVCALTGSVMTFERKSPLLVSLDRIDSGLGYTASNIQFVCTVANCMKSNLPEEYFVQVCKNVVGYASQKQRGAVNA